MFNRIIIPYRSIGILHGLPIVFEPRLNMLKYIFLVLFLVFGLLSEAQQSLSEHLLKEVSVSGKLLPLDTSMLRFYKTSSLSTTDDVLARLSGLSLVRRGAYALEPTIHGFSAGQIGLTIDGMKIFGACTDKMDPISCYVEPENLDAIDISNETKSKNGSSLAGCIDMKLKKPSFSDTSHLFGNLSIGTNTAAKGKLTSINMDYQSQQFALNTNATYRKNENYTNGKGNEVLYSAYEKLNVSMAANYRLAVNHLFSATYLFDREWNVGYAALPMDVGLATAQMASMAYQTQMCDWKLHDVELKVYANSISHFMDDTHRPNIPMHMDMPGYSKTAGANLSMKIGMNPDHQINLKLDYFINSLRAEMTMYPKGEAPMFMLTLPDNQRQTSGIYLADHWNISPLISLWANGRVEATQSVVNSDFGKAELSVLGKGMGNRGTNWCKNVEITASVSPIENLTFTASAHHGERLPTANEWYGFYLFVAFDGYDHIGNTQLKKESANTVDFSFNFSQDRFKFRTRVFKSFVDQYITSASTTFSAMTIGAKGVRQYVNTPSASISGADCELSFKLGRHWQLLATSKYLYGNDGDGNPLPLISPLKTLLNIKYHLGKLSLIGECESAASQNRVAVNIDEPKTPSYTLFNLRVLYRLNIQSIPVDLAIAGENLGNMAYREHLDWGNIYRQGRNFNLSAKFNF